MYNAICWIVMLEMAVEAIIGLLVIGYLGFLAVGAYKEGKRKNGR